MTASYAAQMFDRMSQGVWPIDAGSKSNYVNPRMSAMAGCSRDELSPLPCRSLVRPADDRWISAKIDSRRRGVRDDHECELAHQDGSWVSVLLEAIPLRGDDGEFDGALVTDITERRRAADALTRLFVDARDAVNGTGTLTIGTETVTRDEPAASDHADASPGEHVWLSVTDDGCGMDKATLTHIFEPLFTMKEFGKGTGLGLASVDGVVMQNGRFIDVRSAVGVGTTLTIHVPRHHGAPGAARADGQGGQPVGGHETILLVEDEGAILRTTRRLLEQLGYRVLSASTPGEAVHAAREHGGEVHLLVTDVIMREMNGRELSKTLLSAHPRMRRLFMSGYTADVIAHDGAVDDAVRFIQKPFSRSDLAAEVRSAVDGA